MTEFIYNGRFMSQRITGVQRVARELLAALAKLRDTAPPVLLAPRDARCAAIDGVRMRTSGLGRGILWEQLVFPILASRRKPINLSNSASIFRTGQVVFLHDAAVFDTPAHFSWRFRLWYHVMFWVLARTACCLVTNSHFSRSRLALHCGISERRIAVVELGCDHIDEVVSDTGILATHGLSRGQYVLAVSSRNPTKNHKRLVEAFLLLARDDITLVIVGGDHAAVFHDDDRDSQDDRHDARVRRLGYISDGHLKALYENARCFVFPSLYEGFGIPPLEAMRCGCPVIASTRAALPEVCGSAALYCDALSVADIAAKIALLLDDEALCRLYRQRGRERAARFAWSRSARKLVSAVERAGRSPSIREVSP